MAEKSVMTLQRGANGHLICGLTPGAKPLDKGPRCQRCRKGTAEKGFAWCPACLEGLRKRKRRRAQK